jgi:hypothetical protein
MTARRALGAALTAAVLAVFCTRPAEAVPIFAERYGFSCAQCHTAVPDLNAFGNAFRKAGYRLPKVPTHHEFPFAIRFQNSWTKDLLPSQSRRFNNLLVLISTADFGSHHEYSYFTRYLFGAQGAAGSLYYMFAQHVSDNGRVGRLGLFGLETIEQVTQRNDTITAPIAYTESVGHSSANFTTPRLGAMIGERNNHEDISFAIAFDEYHGAAYGAPAPPSDLAQAFVRPELFGTATFQLNPAIKVGGMILDGERSFTSRSTGSYFEDIYYRDGLQAEWSSDRFDVTAQQLWGRDQNSDGFGTPAGFSGGFLNLKYRPTRHSYIALRYDAAANPFATRDLTMYGVFAPTIHSRFVLEDVRPLGQPGAKSITSAQVLFAVPFTKR